MKTNSIMDKVSRAEAASKSGRLAGYGLAKASKEAVTKMPMSWGPMMRR